MPVPALRLVASTLALAGVVACSSTSTHPSAAGGAAGSGSGGSGGDSGVCNDAGLMTDPDNCGACGHSCLGGECVQGKSRCRARSR